MISQTSEYALRAAVHLARIGGGPATTQQIAGATQVPPGYLSKILRMLAKGGLLQAQRGIGGGFALARPAHDVSVLDVLRCSDFGMERIHECPLGIGSHTELCSLHHLLDTVIAAAEETFKQTSLMDILTTEGPSRPLCDPKSPMQPRISARFAPKTDSTPEADAG